VFFGDAGRAEMLRRAGAEGARAFVVTVNSRSAAERMVKAVLKHRREACVVARAADTTHAERLTQLGAVGVVPEAVEASLQLGARVLEAVGVDDGAIALRLDRVREETLGRIQAAAR
jgi:CPA2 family monovalent cation:H+ antiporter-2